MSNTCILYVEDEDNDVFLLRNGFKRAGITNPLQVATDGQMAIEYLAGTGPFADRGKYPLPGLVLLDLKLPKKDGLEVLQWIRGQHALATVAVIVFTSSPNDDDARRALQFGANSFVIKPARLEQLCEFARRLKAWWLDWNQFVSAGPPDASDTSSEAASRKRTNWRIQERAPQEAETAIRAICANGK